MIDARRAALAATLLATLLGLVVSASVVAQTRRGEDPDWPCVQRLVPTLTAATVWSGPPLDGAGAWQDEPAVASLVRAVTPRAVAPEQGEAAIARFAETAPAGGERDRRLRLAFAGILEETNRERAVLLERIKDLGRRQREIADIASAAGDELRRIPADASGEEAARRTDLEQRFLFVTRAFENAGRTLRFVCEAPVELETRLGRYARALQQHL